MPAPPAMPELSPAFLPFLYGFLILWGLVDCFFGYRVFRLTLAILLAFGGAIIGAWAGFELGGQSPLWALGGMLLGAIAGAVLSAFFYTAAVASLGAFWTFALVSPYLAGLPEWGFWAVAGLACLAAAVLAVYIANTLIMGTTAFGGAFRVVHGVWYFMGGPDVLRLLYAPEDGWQVIEGRLLPLVFILVLGTFGFLFQGWAHYRRTK